MKVLVAQSCLTLCMGSWTVACQAPLSLGFSGPEYWSELLFPSPGDFPDSGTEPRSPELQADSLLISATKLVYFQISYTGKFNLFILALHSETLPDDDT